jgi:hypothetical protein
MNKEIEELIKNEQIINDYLKDLYLESVRNDLDKGEGRRLLAGIGATAILGAGGYTMDKDNQPVSDTPVTYERHTASEQPIKPRTPAQDAYERAQADADNIIKSHTKKDFITKYSSGLSPIVYKQTIKNIPELNQRYSYIHKLSAPALNEVVQYDQNLRNDVHSAHYDKLYNEFNGDTEKMLHAWKNGIKNTHLKFQNNK